MIVELIYILFMVGGFVFGKKMIDMHLDELHRHTELLLEIRDSLKK